MHPDIGDMSHSVRECFSETSVILSDICTKKIRFYSHRDVVFIYTGWRTKCHTIDCARNTFLLLQKHLTLVQN